MGSTERPNERLTADGRILSLSAPIRNAPISSLWSQGSIRLEREREREEFGEGLLVFLCAMPKNPTLL